MAARKAPAGPVGLVTLDDALRPYPVLSKETLRRLIAEGKLASTKVGRFLFVRQADVDELFRPKLRQVAAPPVAEEPTVARPTHGLEPCPNCGAMSSGYHRRICGT
jgi:excisionase family DNA binding protein